MEISLFHAIAERGSIRPARDLGALWWRRHTTRHQLRLMLEQDPERLYDDLGLTEEALRQECRKWFWER